MGIVKLLREIFIWRNVWDFYDWATDRIRNTVWAKAMIAFLTNAATALGFYFKEAAPYILHGALGGMVTALVIVVWSLWTDSRKPSYLKPLIPRALKAIDSRIDARWPVHFGETHQAAKADIKASVRKFLVWNEMVKTQQEYAKEMIERIKANKDHPYNHPEDPNYYNFGLREMIKWQRLAELNFRR